MNKKQWSVLPALVIAFAASSWWTQHATAQAAQPPAAVIKLSHAAPATVPARGTAGSLAPLRARLVDKLQLDATQQAKLDTILGASQPRFMALDKLEESARPLARAKLVGELQLKVNALLTPDQRATYEQMQAQADEQKQAQAPAKGAASAVAKPAL